MIGQIFNMGTREEKFSMALFISLFTYLIYVILGYDMWLPIVIGLLIISVFWLYVFIFDTQWNLIPSRNDQLMLFTITIVALFTAYYSFMYVLPFFAIKTVKLKFHEDNTTDFFYVKTYKNNKEVFNVVNNQLNELHNENISYQEMCDNIKLELSDFANTKNIKSDVFEFLIDFGDNQNE